MMELGNIEKWLGYLAFILISISFLMRSVNKLRLVNTIGSICFIVYGLAIQALPVVLANLFIACVNIYYLARRNVSSGCSDKKVKHSEMDDDQLQV